MQQLHDSVASKIADNSGTPNSQFQVNPSHRCAPIAVKANTSARASDGSHRFLIANNMNELSAAAGFLPWQLTPRAPS